MPRAGKIPVMARVWHRRDDNLDIGLDVESWLADGSIDLVVGQIPHDLLDTGVSDGQWLADAAMQPAPRRTSDRAIVSMTCVPR